MRGQTFLKYLYKALLNSLLVFGSECLYWYPDSHLIVNEDLQDERCEGGVDSNEQVDTY